MKITLNTNQIADELRKDENANWSFYGARALAEYLEEYEESTGEELELDICSLRCDFSEYENLRKFLKEYHGTALNVALERSAIDVSDMEDDDELDEAIREYICDRGTLIEFDSGIIVSAF